MYAGVAMPVLCHDSVDAWESAYRCWQLQQLQYCCHLQQLQLQLPLQARGSCGSRNSKQLAGACQKKQLMKQLLLLQMQQLLQLTLRCGSTCQSHRHSILCSTLCCSGSHNHGRSHLQSSQHISCIRSFSECCSLSEASWHVDLFMTA